MSFRASFCFSVRTCPLPAGLGPSPGSCPRRCPGAAGLASRSELWDISHKLRFRGRGTGCESCLVTGEGAEPGWVCSGGREGALGSAVPDGSESGCFSSILSPLGPEGGPAVGASLVSVLLCCGRAPASARPPVPAPVTSPAEPCLSSRLGTASSGEEPDSLFSEGVEVLGSLGLSRAALGTVPWGLSGLGKG